MRLLNNEQKTDGRTWQMLSFFFGVSSRPHSSNDVFILPLSVNALERLAMSFSTFNKTITYCFTLDLSLSISGISFAVLRTLASKVSVSSWRGAYSVDWFSVLSSKVGFDDLLSSYKI